MCFSEAGLVRRCAGFLFSSSPNRVRNGVLKPRDDDFIYTVYSVFDTRGSNCSSGVNPPEVLPISGLSSALVRRPQGMSVDIHGHYLRKSSVFN